MSLRAFHLLFIALSVILAAFFGAWSIGQYRAAEKPCTCWSASRRWRAASAWHLQRLPAQDEGCREPVLRIFVLACLFAAAPRVALACPVCFGQNDSPMANAINMGIIAMLVVVAGVLGAFASFFIYLMRRARLAARESEGTV
jgi:hypothetical protein